MLELPARTAIDPGEPTHHREWAPAGYAKLLARWPQIPPAHLIGALLAVLVHRYGSPCRLAAAPGCGAVGAVLRLLAARGENDAVGLSRLLAEAASGGPTENVGANLGLPSMLVAATGHEPGPADLTWTVGKPAVRVCWRPSVYPDPTVTSMLGHLQRLIEQAADPAAGAIADLDLLTDPERERNGGTPATLPEYPPITLHQLFMLQAWRTPGATALRCADGELTYRELDEASNHLAHHLIEAGTRPGDVVAVCAQRSLGLFIGALAAVKAGGVFVYLDPSLPEPRLRQLVGVARPRVVLRGPGARPPAGEAPELALAAVPDPNWPGLSGPPDVVVGPEDPAYLLFTSGSTGTPKGVLRPHRLHTSRIFLEQRMYQLGPADRMLLKLTLSARELFWPLSTGATAVIAEPGGERDDRYLVSLMRSEQISVVNFVPSMLRIVAANPDFAKCTSIRHLFVGGEVFPADLERQVRAMGFPVHLTYTLTEADYVVHRSDPLDRQSTGCSVIGRPLDMRVYLCDDADRLVPPGLVGQLLVGGPGLATGYYGDPVRTAERFVANPFGDRQAPVLFRTGDLARLRADGMLEYHGRRDLQVKVRGQRIEPTEVEDWIRAHPGVRNAAVVGYPDADQGAVLVAFVVPGQGEVTDAGLRGFLAVRIPEYMVPRHFVRIPRLPQLPNGKIDRAALKPPAPVRPAGMAPAVAPVTPTQHRLSGLWRRVLRVDEVGIDDPFTQLGGDSLRLMVLRAAIEDDLGIALDLAELLRAGTIREQAALVEAPRPPGAAAGRSTETRADALRFAAAERARRAGLRAVAGRSGGEPEGAA